MDPMKYLKRTLRGCKPGHMAKHDLIGLVGFGYSTHWAYKGQAERIINECNADCGENVGGQTAAPEVAAEEDDGDGDGDPDPDRRPKRRTATPLPSAQLLRPKAACALLGIGRTKLWQLSERDPRFPRKIVLGPRCVGWRIDALNGYLRTLEQEG